MRLIDADALIEKLQKEEEMVETDGYYCDNYKLIAELKRTPTACAWIPVEERLPENTGTYLVTAQNEHFATVLVDSYWMGTDVYPAGWHYEELMKYKYIAWMPLPEPYNPKQSTT